MALTLIDSLKREKISSLQYLLAVALAQHGRPGGSAGHAAASPAPLPAAAEAAARAATCAQPARPEGLPEALVEGGVEDGVGHGRRDPECQGESVQHKLSCSARFNRV